MACLECELGQAVGDAGTCARCGAPLPGDGHPSGTFTSPGGAELRVDSSGIRVRRKRGARGRLISWAEIGWFRDGWHEPGSGEYGWMLDIVLASGRVEEVRETWTAPPAPPELLALIRRAAAAHSIPAVLTGGPVCGGLPTDDVWRDRALLYFDPAGEPGLREWNGTEWSPFLHVDPGASGHPGQEAGLTRIWSPLSPAELDRQSRTILDGNRFIFAAFLGCGAFLTLVVVLIAVLMASGHLDLSSGYTLAGLIGAFGVVFLASGVGAAWAGRRQRRVALALRTAAARALAHDDPPVPVEPPDLRAN